MISKGLLRALALVAPFAALVDCNAILGIEEANPRPVTTGDGLCGELPRSGSGGGCTPGTNKDCAYCGHDCLNAMCIGTATQSSSPRAAASCPDGMVRLEAGTFQARPLEDCLDRRSRARGCLT
jgi:hypothetical protein